MVEMMGCVIFKDALRNAIRYCYDLFMSNDDVMAVTIHIHDGILHHQYHIRHRGCIIELEPVVENAVRNYKESTFELTDSIHCKSIFCSWLNCKLRKIFHDCNTVAPCKLFLEQFMLVRDDIGVFPVHDTLPISEHSYTWEPSEAHRHDIRDLDKYLMIFKFLEERLGFVLRRFFTRREQPVNCSVEHFIRWLILEAERSVLELGLAGNLDDLMRHMQTHRSAYRFANIERRNKFLIKKQYILQQYRSRKIYEVSVAVEGMMLT